MAIPLYAKGWKEQDLLALFKFLNGIIALPPKLELAYNGAIEKREEEFKLA